MKKPKLLIRCLLYTLEVVHGPCHRRTVAVELPPKLYTLYKKKKVRCFTKQKFRSQEKKKKNEKKFYDFFLTVNNSNGVRRKDAGFTIDLADLFYRNTDGLGLHRHSPGETAFAVEVV